MSTPEKLRAEAAADRKEAADSFERCDTAGFLSQWASGINARLKDAEADLIETGGLHRFLILTDLEGNYVHAKLIDGRYGPCWMLLDDDGNRTGQYVNAIPARESTLARKGYCEGYAMFRAKAAIMGGGKGLSGCASAYVGYKQEYNAKPVEVVSVSRWKDAPEEEL